MTSHKDRCIVCLIGSKICHAKSINFGSEGDSGENYVYRFQDVDSDDKIFKEGEGEKSLNREVREINDYSDESIDKDLHNSNEAELNLFSWWKGQGRMNGTLTTKASQKSSPGLPDQGFLSSNPLNLQASTLNSIHIIQVVDYTPQNNRSSDQLLLNPPSLPANLGPTPQRDSHLASPSSLDKNFRTVCFTVNEYTKEITCPPGCIRENSELAFPIAPKSYVSTVSTPDKTEKPFTPAEYTRLPRIDATHSVTFTVSSTPVNNFWFKEEPSKIHASTNSGMIIPLYQAPVSNVPNDMFATDNFSMEQKPVFTLSSFDNNSWPIIVPHPIESSNKQYHNFEFMTNTQSALKFISNETSNENKTVDAEEPFQENSKQNFFSNFHRLLDRNLSYTKISLPQNNDNLESPESNISNFFSLNNDTTRGLDKSLEITGNVTNNDKRSAELVDKNMFKSSCVQKCVGADGNTIQNYGQTFPTLKNLEKIESSQQSNTSLIQDPLSLNSQNLISSENANVGNTFQKKEYLPENTFERKSIDVPLSTTMHTLMSSHLTFQAQNTTRLQEQNGYISTNDNFVLETDPTNKINLTQYTLEPPRLNEGFVQDNPKQLNETALNRTILIIENTVTNPNSPSKLEILPGKIYVIQANIPEKKYDMKQFPAFKGFQLDQSTIKNSFTIDSIGKDVKATFAEGEVSLAHQTSGMAGIKENTIPVTSSVVSVNNESMEASALFDLAQGTEKYMTSIETPSGEQKKDIVDFQLMAEIPKSSNMKNSLHSSRVSNVRTFKLQDEIIHSPLSGYSTNAEILTQETIEFNTLDSLGISSHLQSLENQMSSADGVNSLNGNPPDLTKLNLEQVVAGVLTSTTAIATKCHASSGTHPTTQPLVPFLVTHPADVHQESEPKAPLLLSNNNNTDVKTKDITNEPVLQRKLFEPIELLNKSNELSNKFVNSVQSFKPGSLLQTINQMNATIKEENKLIKKVMDDTEKIDREITLKSDNEVNKTYDRIINEKDKNTLKIGRSRRETATPSNSSKESQIENETRVYYFKYNDSYLAQHSKDGVDLVEYCKNVTCKGDNFRFPCCGSKVLCKGEDLSYLLPIPGYSTTTTSSPPSAKQKANSFLIRIPRRDDTMNNLVKFQLMHGISAPDSKELMNALKEVSYQVQKVNREFHPELNLPPPAPPPRNPPVFMSDRQMLANNYLTAAAQSQMPASPGCISQMMDTNKILENLKSTLADSIFHTQLGQNDIIDKYRAVRNYDLPPVVLQESSALLGALRRKAEEEAQRIIDIETQKKRDEEIYRRGMDDNFELIQDTNLSPELEKKNTPLLDPRMSKIENLKRNSYLTLLQHQLGNDNIRPNKDFYYSEVRNNPDEYPEKIIPQSDGDNSCSKFTIQGDNSNSEVRKRVERGIDEGKSDNSKNIITFKEAFDSFHNDLLDLQKFVAAKMAGGQRNNIAFSKNMNSSSSMQMGNER